MRSGMLVMAADTTLWSCDSRQPMKDGNSSSTALQEAINDLKFRIKASITILCPPWHLLEVPQQQAVGQLAARRVRVLDDPTQLRLQQTDRQRNNKINKQSGDKLRLDLILLTTKCFNISTEWFDVSSKSCITFKMSKEIKDKPIIQEDYQTLSNIPSLCWPLSSFFKNGMTCS